MRDLTLYLLEKLQQEDPSAVRKTAEAFSVTASKVYDVLNGLMEEGIVSKVQRGKYALVRTEQEFRLKRSLGELVSEDRICARTVLPLVRDLPHNVVQIWEYILGEMVNNIIDHSQAENLTITVRRSALKTEVLLLDDGVGIFEKIRGYFGYETPEEAVSELFKGKLTTDAVNHSGEGIFFSSRLADSFLIFSGGNVFTHDRFNPEDCLRMAGCEMPEKGTLVYVALANSTKKKSTDVFDLFADPDSGFTKTQIPVANYFEGSPVSRSQAKRLSGRLDSFREVRLDFTDVEWMGQGFAHQLFVVFAAAHPEVTLVPVSMNPDVEKMYRHVMNG